MTKFFFRLSPHIVLNVVERAGFRPTGHLVPLTCLENRVYDVSLEDDRNVVIKFYRPGRWSRPSIQEEHAFLEDLRISDVPVCSPLQLPDGNTLGKVEDIYYAIWPRTGGRNPDELQDDDIAVLGRLLARLHNVGATRPMPTRPPLDAEYWIHSPLSSLESEGFLPPSCARRYREAALEIANRYESRSREVPVHRIHGDCHFGNLLRAKDGWFFLDFDDCIIGPAVHDVWMLLPGRDREGMRQRSLFIESYKTFRDFEEGWLDLIEVLRGMRYIWYAAWIARRFSDPAFPDAFPHFGTENYWDSEATDLEDQLEVIDRRHVDAQGQFEEAETFSNRDFFWDL